jgi:hypothetical protein
MKHIRRDPVRAVEAGRDGRRPYERPTIQVFTDEEILELLGPAQGYSGDPIGTPGGSGL